MIKNVKNLIANSVRIKSLNIVSHALCSNSNYKLIKILLKYLPKIIKIIQTKHNQKIQVEILFFKFKMVALIIIQTKVNNNINRLTNPTSKLIWLKLKVKMIKGNVKRMNFNKINFLIISNPMKLKTHIVNKLQVKLTNK